MGEHAARAAAAAIRDAHVTMGPIVERLEAGIAEALGAPHVVAAPSGSAALALAYMALGVKAGDEVIVPNRTFIATAHAAMLLGARVVLADVGNDRPLLDAESLRRAITPRTRLVVPVHLNGCSVRMDAVNRLAAEHGFDVVEDACQALFSRNAAGFLGTQSRIGCYSLGITKLVSSGIGGLAVTSEDDLAARMRLLRNQGMADTFTCEYQLAGFNFKYSDVLAAMALAQLSRVDEKVRRVREIYAAYAEALRELPDFELLPVDVAGGELPIYVEALSPRRTELAKFLQAAGVQTRIFPSDLAAAPYLAPPSGMATSKFAAQGIVLPCGPDQPLENVAYVIEVLRRFADLNSHRE
jgi:dTDP-4-amino-4,6-dideoxygalactose transaminase